MPEVRPRSPQVAHQALAPCVARKWSGPTSVQLRSGFGPTLGRLFQHAQGLGEFDVVLDPWPITRILTSPESVVYLIEFISSIIRCD